MKGDGPCPDCGCPEEQYDGHVCDEWGVPDPSTATPLPAPGMTDLMVTPESIDAAILAAHRVPAGPCASPLPESPWPPHLRPRQRCLTACAESVAGLPCACNPNLDALHAKDVKTEFVPCSKPGEGCVDPETCARQRATATDPGWCLYRRPDMKEEL